MTFNDYCSALTTMDKARRLMLLGGLLLLAAMLSLCAGARWIGVGQAIAALWHYDALNISHILVTTSRLPRTLLALVVGASLAVAGSLMQALTRNPLASPGLFGINAGATFMIVLFSSLLAVSSLQAWLGCAFAGAALAGTLVWLIGQRGRGALNPLRMVLAGASIAALFTAFSQAMLVVDQQGLDSVLFWLAGSLSERELPVMLPLIAVSLAALGLTLLLAGQINVLNAGDEIAQALGQRSGRIRLMAAVLVVLLAGSAVALAGSIGFIGLVVPHMARRLLSGDQRWQLPGCAILGALLLLLADMLARLVILPQEVPVGVMTALFGAPLFILLVRRGGRYG